MRYIKILIYILLFHYQNLYSTHIVGADLTYRCISGSQYEVTLTLYRDCYNGQAGFDEPLTLYIFNTNDGSTFSTHDLYPDTTLIPLDWQRCVLNPPNLCVSEGVYKKIINLPPRLRGYDIGWARCCRNGNITNLISPLDRGITFLAHVPGSEITTCNSMPTFIQKPKTFLCAGNTFTFDHSAIDIDGDSLVYRLSNPFDGQNFNGQGVSGTGGALPPAVGPSNPLGPPPYQNVPFAFGYSFLNPFGSASPISIDPNTGFLSITPAFAGIFVVAISVLEYRNGVLLSENKRDLQMYVVNCLPPDPPPTITHNFGSIPSNGDTIFVLANKNFCYTFTVDDNGSNTPLTYVQGVNSVFSQGVTMTLNGNNPVNGTICWTPSCNLVNQIVPIIITAKDQNDCDVHTPVFDTIFVKISTPPPAPPQIIPNLAGTVFNGDTMFVEMSNNLCFFMSIKDTSTVRGNLTYTYSAQNNGTQNVNFSIINSNPDSIYLKVCWLANCAALNDTVLLIVNAIDNDICPPFNRSSDTLYILVYQLPNPKPILDQDFTGLTLIADTIQIFSENTLCYNFTLRDSMPSSLLSISAKLLGTGGGNQPNITITNQNDTLIQGKVCWVPSCNYLDKVVGIELSGKDNSDCKLDYTLLDTAWIKFQLPNPKPILTQDFTGLTLIDDTIQVYSENSFCYNFQLKDSMPASKLGVSVKLLATGNQPNLFISNQNDTLIEGRVCWTPSCNLIDKVVGIVITAKDSTKCKTDYILTDTAWVKFQLPNPPPLLTQDFAGLTVINDTIQVFPDTSMCYSFEFKDQMPSSHLSISAKIIGNSSGSQPNLTITTQNDTLIQGKICWIPSCTLINQTIGIEIVGLDSTKCKLDYIVKDTAWVHINLKPLGPIVISHDFLTQNSNGDTLILQVKKEGCIEVKLMDLDSTRLGNLEVTKIEPSYNFGLFTISNGTGTTNVNATICYTPICEFVDTTIRIILKGLKTTTCYGNIEVYDTFFVRIIQIANLPPVISHVVDNYFGPNTIATEPGKPICYTVILQDVDNFSLLDLKGLSEIFDEEFGFGSNAVMLDTIKTINSMQVQICINPNCYTRRLTKELIVCGYDTTSCYEVIERCDTLKLQILDCGLSYPNVFTPNGDGINDTFGPFEMEGISSFEIQIFDRWGQALYTSVNSGRWDGTFNSNNVPEGVYFYNTKFILQSGTGEKLYGTRTGSFSLLR